MSLLLPLLIQKAMTVLWANAPKDGVPYSGGFSGGKDSCVIKELAFMAEVPVVWRYRVTTLDPPELLYFIRKHHPDVVWERPEHGNMLHRALTKGFPTRQARWCCDEYKELPPPKGVPTILGVRIAESRSRSQRWTKCVMEYDDNPDHKLVLPIRLWGDEDVWEFLRVRGTPYSSLYDEGFKRLGCIGCPLTSKAQRDMEFVRWPKYEEAWKRMFRKLWEMRSGSTDRNGNEWWGSRNFNSWQELWEWWHGGTKNVEEWKKASSE